MRVRIRALGGQQNRYFVFTVHLPRSMMTCVTTWPVIRARVDHVAAASATPSESRCCTFVKSKMSVACSIVYSLAQSAIMVAIAA
jgi:hypothetical protein